MEENEGLLNKRSVHSEIDSSFDFITGFPCVVRRYSKTYYPWSLSVETIITVRNMHCILSGKCLSTEQENILKVKTQPQHCNSTRQTGEWGRDEKKNPISYVSLKYGGCQRKL